MTGLFAALVRLAPGPLLMRTAVFVSAGLALVTAVPAPVRQPAAVPALLVLAALPALLPAGRTVTLTASVAILGWLVATSSYHEPVSPVRLLIVAGTLYLLHSSAALAAVLPLDAVVPPEVLRRWLVHAVVTLVAGGLLALLLLAAGSLGPAGSTLYALIAAFALAAALVWLMALMRRR